jgi:hypothetical protein
MNIQRKPLNLFRGGFTDKIRKTVTFPEAKSV